MAQADLYIFGPQERRGLVAGVRAGQVVMALTFVGVGLAALQVVRSPIAQGLVAITILVGGGCVTFLPIGTRTSDQWAPLILGWVWRSLRGTTSWTSTTHLRGTVGSLEMASPGTVALLPTEVNVGAGAAVHLTGNGPPQVTTERVRDKPPTLQGLSILRAGDRDSRHQIGIIKDARAGTWTGILAVRGHGWALADDSEKDRAARSWGAVLASVAVPSSPVHRIQWLEGTHVEERGALDMYFQHGAVCRADDPEYRSYASLIASSAAATQQHEVLVAVQISRARAWRAIRGAAGEQGGPPRREREDVGACTVLDRELDALASRLRAANVDVLGKLPSESVARHLRLAYDPGARPARRVLENARGEEGVEPENAWPRAQEEHFRWLRTESGCHTTLHVSEWPRMEVGAAFLAPLLLQTRAQRVVSVTMEVLQGDKAAREVRAAQTAQYGDERMRNRLGFRTSARDAREAAVAERVEQELADGHASVRFSGFVTVTAPAPEELEQAVQEVEQMASMSRLELTRLVGQQAAAFTFTLPLCRGLAT